MTPVREHLLPHPPPSPRGLSPYFDLFRPADPVPCLSPFCPPSLLPTLLNHCKPPSTPNKKRTLVHGWPSTRKYLKRDCRKLRRSTWTKPAWPSSPRFFLFSLAVLLFFFLLDSTFPKFLRAFHVTFEFAISSPSRTPKQSQYPTRNDLGIFVQEKLIVDYRIVETFERKIQNRIDSYGIRLYIL